MTDRADAAGHALAARFAAEKCSDAKKDLLQINGIVEEHDDAGAKSRANGTRAFERERRIQFLRGNETACGASKQNRLQPPGSTDTAGHFDDVSNRRAKRNFINARPDNMPRDTEQPIPG